MNPLMLLPFVIAAGQRYLGARQQRNTARQQYDARYNSPQYLMRNALLNQLWREHNLADRFAQGFPDQASLPPGTMGKTPENILIAATTPPRFQGQGTGSMLFDAAMSNLQFLPGMAAPRQSPTSGGGSLAAEASAGGAAGSDAGNILGDLGACPPGQTKVAGHCVPDSLFSGGY